MIENLIIRLIEMKDAAQFRDNLYSRDTLEQIQALITGNIQKTAQDQLRHIVAELDSEVKGNGHRNT